MFTPNSIQDALEGLFDLCDTNEIKYMKENYSEEFDDIDPELLAIAFQRDAAVVSKYHVLSSAGDGIDYDIPSSWKWAYLKDACVYLQRGKSPKYSPIEQIPVIAQKCNQWSGFQIEKAQFIEPSSLSTYTKERILQDGDVLINSTGLGTLGRIAIYPESSNPYGIAVADSHVTVVRLNRDIMLPEFFYMYWANPSVQFVVESQATGSTKQKELGLKTIQGYLIPVPPIEEQIRIIEKMKTLLPACEF